MDYYLKPQEDPYVTVRLEWMRDNQPELLLEWYKQGILQEKLIIGAEKANDLRREIVRNGGTEEQGEEAALNLLAPPENLLLEREVMQIPEEKFEEILIEITS